MELNVINYILDTKKITQNELAEMLDPPVSKSILSKWKNGGESIPVKRINELYRIARVDEFREEKWLSLTNNSKEIADDWYWKFDEYLPHDANIWKGRNYGDINYDSVWIDNIQRMLITLNDAGVPVDELDVTFDLERDIDFVDDDGEPHWVYTDADELIFPYIKAYLTLRSWANKFIININNKDLGKLQFDLALIATRIALLQIPRDKFDAVGTDLDILDKYNKETKKEAFQLITEFSSIITKNGGILFIDYFRYLNGEKKLLELDVNEQTAKEYQDDIESESFLTTGERRILEGIKKNEKLLKELLEKLNK